MPLLASYKKIALPYIQVSAYIYRLLPLMRVTRKARYKQIIKGVLNHGNEG